MIGTTLSHFRITAKLGEGGMGEVYRAEDTTLGRDVAVKVLPAGMADDPERLERFKREARTLAALDHPNIVTIHSIETDDGITFLTMSLVDGDGLDRLITAEGLPASTFFEFAVPIADAVAAAHDKGITHRDLKPSNVMVTGEDRVKVLDFGLAKIEPRGDPGDSDELPTMAMTQEGMVMGTAPYMSPEQTKGEPVDGRSDIFSLGIMLYEMAAGTRPFQGDTAAEMISSILRDTPTPISEVRPDLPNHLRRVLSRCLEKKQADRYQSARDVVIELKGLQRELESGEVTQTRPARDTATSASVTTSHLRGSAFVGREEERAKLDQMLAEAIECRGGLVLLGGEPGVGKTRLAAEILEDGRTRGMLPLAGHAYEDETAPFVMASEILEEMIRLVPKSELRRMLGINASEISRLLPELRTLYSDIPEPADVPPEMLQRNLFKSVLEFLTRASAEKPLVMLLDDIHWADESSLQLLEHLAPRLSNLPILILGTYRDVEADMGPAFFKAMANLVRQRLAERIHISTFDETSVAEILAVLGRSNPPPELAHAVHQATEGNVFFIEEIFRHLSEEGQLLDSDGNWIKEIDIASLDVPEGVRLVTARRIERLTEATRKVLSMASVIGLRFPVRVLEAASPDADLVLDAIEEAEAAQLLKPAAGGREIRYEFVHALARQTLLGDLSPLRQQRMHLGIADAIEQTTGGLQDRSAADIAHHLIEAGQSADTDKTVRWLTAAGSSAVAAAAMDEAAHYFDTALALLNSDQAEARAELLHLRGSARRSLGLRDEFLTDLTAAFGAFESLGLAEKAAAVVSEMSYALIWNGQPDEAKTLIERALKLVGTEESAPRCRLLSAEGLASGMGSEPTEAIRAHEAAVTLARSLDSPALLAEVLQNHSIDGWFRLDGVTLEAAGHEAAALRREMKHEWNLAHCLWMEQAGLVWQGRYHEAELINDELHPLAERNDDLGSLAISAMMNCLIEQAHGNLTDSSRHMRRSIKLFEAGGFPWGWISEGHYSVNALLAGDHDHARTAFELAGEHALPGLVWSGADICYLLSGKARLGDPDTLELFESLRNQLPRAGEPKPSGVAMLLKGAIEALVLVGKDNEAAELYPAMRDLAESDASIQDFTYGFHHRFAGMAAAAGRDWKASEAHFQKALQLSEDLPHRVNQARVRYWWARALLTRQAAGDLEQAHQLLGEARGLSEPMGMHGLVTCIDELLATLPGHQLQ